MIDGMYALTVEPARAGSALLERVPAPPRDEGALLVKTLAVGVCGTDRHILEGKHGRAPAGSSRLIIGHEAIGAVVSGGDGFAVGELVVPIVRRPDPAPCRYCAAGEWDMCSNGRYRERGIKELNGFCSQYFRVEQEFAVRAAPHLGLLGVLLEPASIVAKAWDHTWRIGARASAWAPQTLLVTGAGPIGLLAALMGVQRGLDVHVLDRVRSGPKPDLVRRLGAVYHGEPLSEIDLAADIVMECTGASALIAEVLRRTQRSGIVCLTGLSSGEHRVSLDAAGLNRSMVLENDAVFGSVNANRAHYEAAAAALAAADRAWLNDLITRRVPLARWRDAFDRSAEDIKAVIDFTIEDELGVAH